MSRSEVRRLRLFDVEQVRHQQPGQEWVPHWHDEWSFGAIVEGRCRCSVAGRPFEARAGDLMAIAPGVVHTGALLGTARRGGVRVTMLYVPADWLAHAGVPRPERSGWLRHVALAREAQALDSAEDVAAWLRRAVPALAAAPADARGTAADPMPTPAERALLERLQVAVADGERSVSGLAARCGVSRERVHRVVRHLLGMTPSDYLRAVRLHRAKQAVLEGAPIASVATDAGFADQAHFTRWFRRTFGYTPGDLAAAVRE
jgi:AraC-like DNA-binding protein